jgi:hypothetical protein
MKQIQCKQCSICRASHGCTHACICTHTTSVEHIFVVRSWPIALHDTSTGAEQVLPQPIPSVELNAAPAITVTLTNNPLPHGVSLKSEIMARPDPLAN